MFRIPTSGLDDLARVADHAEQLAQILLTISGCQMPADESLAANHVSEKLGLSYDSVRDVLDGLSSLRGLMARNGFSVEELLLAVDASIERYALDAWKNKSYPKWKAAREPIAAALRSIPNDSPILIYQKTKELTYAHQFVLTEVNVITDLRPVFDQNAEQVLALVLTHVLMISYQDGSDSRRIEFALDATDMLKLQRAAERAQKKTALLRKATGEIRTWPLLVAGQLPSD